MASLHNTLLFTYPRNYRDDVDRVTKRGDTSVLIPQVVDNDYTTFTTEKDIDINIAEGSSPTRVDAVLIKGTGITAHSGTPSGGSGSGWSNRSIPGTIDNYNGVEVSTTVHDFQHDLYLLPNHFTATSVRLRLTGTNARLYAVMLLELKWEIDANNGDFTQIYPDFVDRSGQLDQSPRGRLSRSEVLGASRSKWEIDYAIKVIPGKTLIESVDDLVLWFSENPNIGFVQEFSRYPWRAFPATQTLLRIPTRPRNNNYKGAGDIVSINIAEQ